MRITIVTVSYNQRTYLKEAIDSVLAQGHGDLEYIIVDPGSSDGSRELIESYGNRIAQKIFEKDRGAADGLNKGFELATGDIYGFVNADDLLYPGALRKVAEFFRSHPECDVLMGNGYTIDADGREIRHYRAHGFTVRRYLHGGTHFLQQSTFFRAGTFRRSPKFNVENRTSWDGELFVNFARQGATFAYIDADLGAFRIHGESISGSGRMNAQYVSDCRRIFRQVQGHDWGTGDELLRLAYRVESLLRRLVVCVPHLRKDAA